MQAPIKQRYREQPEAAVVTLKAEGQLGDDLSCSVQTRRALVEAGLHPATGGDGSQACSGYMLLQALCGGHDALSGYCARDQCHRHGLEPKATWIFEGR